MSKPEVSAPRRINLTQLNKVLMGYLKAGADAEAVNYKEVSQISGIDRIKVSLNNSFLVESGFLIQEKRGFFRLTQNGTEYARFLTWGRVEDAKNPLKRIINEYPLFKKIIDYTRINVAVTREDLVSRVAAITGFPKTSGYERGMNTVVDLLLFSGMINEEDGTISAVEITKAEKPIEKVSVLHEEERLAVGKRITFPINVTINVSENTPKQKFKEFMEIIKEIFSGEQKETE